MIRQLKDQEAGINKMNCGRAGDQHPHPTASNWRFSIKDIGENAKKAVVAEITQRANTAIKEAKAEKARVEAALQADTVKRDDAKKKLDQALKDLDDAKKKKQSRGAAGKAARSARDAASKEHGAAEKAMERGKDESTKQAGRITVATTARGKLAGLDVTNDAATQAALDADEVGAFTRRYDNMKAFERLHEEAIAEMKADKAFLKRWDGLLPALTAGLALLHNPDQVIGGKGLFDLAGITVVAKPEPGASPDEVARWNKYVSEIKAHCRAASTSTSGSVASLERGRSGTAGPRTSTSSRATSSATRGTPRPPTCSGE